MICTNKVKKVESGESVRRMENESMEIAGKMYVGLGVAKYWAGGQ